LHILISSLGFCQHAVITIIYGYSIGFRIAGIPLYDVTNSLLSARAIAVMLVRVAISPLIAA